MGDGSRCRWHRSDERLFLSMYYKKYFCIKKQIKSASSPRGCSWGAEYGRIGTLLSVVPSPTQQKDVAHVAPPAHRRACAGRNCSCCPCGLSQRASVSDLPG